MPVPSPAPAIWLQDVAALGEALAGTALFLAIWIFVRDRGTADRAQVDKPAAGIEWDSGFTRTPGQPFWVNVRVFLRNASQLPIEIVHVGAEIRSRWAVLDILQSDQRGRSRTDPCRVSQRGLRRSCASATKIWPARRWAIGAEQPGGLGHQLRREPSRDSEQCPGILATEQLVLSKACMAYNQKNRPKYEGGSLV